MKTEDITAFVQSIAENADRLGLKWNLQPGVVQTVDATYAKIGVRLDGDDATISVMNITGDQIFVGDRVMTLGVPPAGHYIIGRMAPRVPMVYSAACDALSNFQGVEADLSGATVTFTTTVPSAYMASIVIDARLNVADSAIVGVGKLFIDGVDAGPEAIYSPSNIAAGGRATVAQYYVGSLAAGSHTFKIRIVRVGGADSHLQCNATHSTVSVMVV